MSDARLSSIGKNMRTDTKIFCLSCKDPSYVFLFGANLAGKHGRGAALHAKQYHGAVYGKGEGLQGQSYALPTKSVALKTLTLTQIRRHVETFIEFAKVHPEMKFFITECGTGLASIPNTDMAPMFADAPDNCVLSERWRKIRSTKS